MKYQLCMLSLSVALGVAAAQTPPPTPPAGSQGSEQSDTKTAPPAATPNTLPEMKTSTFKGTLVDMSCASSSPSTSAAAQPSETPKTMPAETSKTTPSEQANSANRSTGDSGASCPVTANSSQLGVKLNDGKTVRFDLVGNQRAQDAIKNDKRWNKDLSANKPIQVKISGVLNGDKLIVSSIH